MNRLMMVTSGQGTPTAGRTLRRLGAMVAATGLAVGVGISGLAQAGPNLVTNGSFETGDFTGWTQTGNTGFTGVQCPGPGFVPEGNCDAFFGPVGSVGGILETLTTLPGRFYDISFAFQPDGGIPSSFQALFGGASLVSLNNPPGGGFQSFSFNRLATSPSTTIEFKFRDDPGFLALDNVRVSVPEPATVALLGIGLAGLWAGRRRKAQ